MNNDLIQQMCDLYNQGYTGRQIADVFGFKNSKSVYDKLEKVGHKRRRPVAFHDLRRKYDPNFMKIIDADWKAYFLGLLLTDGWVLDNNTVALSLVDKEAIEVLSMFIGQPYTTIQYKDERRQNAYKICMRSEVLAKDLRRFGMVPRKTYGLPACKLHNVELKYIGYILRGIIDGDGTFGFPSNSPENPYCRIVEKVPDLLVQAKEWFEILGMRNLEICAVSGQAHLYIGGTNNMNIIRSSIYRDSFGMTRKRNLVLRGRLTSKEVSENPEYAGNSLESDLLYLDSNNDQNWTIRREASIEEPSETAIRSAE